MDNTTEFSLQECARLLNVESSNSLNNDFFIVIRDFSPLAKELKQLHRIGFYTAMFCIQGELSMEINLKKFTLTENSFIIFAPGSIVRCGYNEQNNAQLMIMAASRDFLSALRFDFSHLFNESMTSFDNPSLTLTSEEFEIGRSFFHLINNIYNSKINSKKECLQPVIASAFQLLGDIWTKRISDTKGSFSNSSARSKLIFDNFLKLVIDNYTQERNVSYYADRLCLTPKYLSKLVREVTGKSAPEWIDSYVILEAKNLLRYSELSIKEIIFKLNFSSLSSFYKFFKSHTGKTPVEYREG